MIYWSFFKLSIPVGSFIELCGTYSLLAVYAFYDQFDLDYLETGATYDKTADGI